MPVSWQIGPVSSVAMSTLDKIMSNACEDWVPGVSLPAAIAIAARTSGGRFVDVWVISSSRLPARNSIGISKVALRFLGFNETRISSNRLLRFPIRTVRGFRGRSSLRAGNLPLAPFYRKRKLVIGMPSDSIIRTETRTQGLRIKRNNLIVALLSGLTLAFISVVLAAPS